MNEIQRFMDERIFSPEDSIRVRPRAFDATGDWRIVLHSAEVPVTHDWFWEKVYQCAYFAPRRLIRRAVCELAHHRSQAEDIEKNERAVTERLARIRGNVDPRFLRMMHLLNFPDRLVQAAVLARHLPSYLELLRTNPQLAYFFLDLVDSLNTARPDCLDAPATLLRGGAMAILEALGWPRYRRTLRALRHLTIAHLRYFEREKEAWGQALDDHEFVQLILNLGLALPAATLTFFDQVGLPSAALARDIANETLRDPSDFVSDHDTLTSTIEDTVRMMNQTDDDPRRLLRVNSWRRVVRIHDELAAELREPATDFAYVESFYSNSLDDDLPPPLESPSWMTPLRTRRDILRQARQFRNCTASYIIWITGGAYYLWLVHHPDAKRPAMLGLKRTADGEPWIFDQCYGPGNKSVSRAVRTDILRWIEANEKCLASGG